MTTGPDGDQSRGSWQVLETEAPHRLVVRDGFANADGTPNTNLPIDTAKIRTEEVGQVSCCQTRVNASCGGQSSWDS